MLDLSEDGKEVGTADPFLKKEENSSARQRTRILLRKTRRKHMTDTFSLPRLEPGFSAIIAQLTAQGEMRRRLQDMGFIPGTTVACLQRSPLGDPTAYRIREAVIALREEDARHILLKKEASHGR